MSTHSEVVSQSSGDLRYRATRRVTLVGAVVNVLLAMGKILIGLLGGSQALVADGIHSLSDLLTDVMVIFAAKHGSRDADEDHPYGHGRIETIMTVALGVVLLVVAVGIGIDAVSRLFNTERLTHPGMLALAMAAISVIAKEALYHYTHVVARKIRSNMLRANAWHHRSDAVSSLVVIVGIGGTMAGLPYLDAMAAVAVALMIAKIGWDLSWNSIHELIDTALEQESVEAIRRVILSVDGVRAMHMLRTRRSGGDALVDVHILVDPRLSVSEGHFISETVQRRLLDEVPEVQDVLVHIDPEDDQSDSPSKGLPSRHELLSALADYWDQIPGAEKRTRVTLHYLDGGIQVDVAVPLDAVGDSEQAHRFGELMQRPAAELDVVTAVHVYYY